jgi:hypothetical protein
LEVLIEKYKVTNLCIPGHTVSDALREEDAKVGLSFDLQEDDYSLALICLGTNDFCQGALAEFEVIPNLLTLLAIIPSTLKVGIFGFPFEEKASMNEKGLQEMKTRIDQFILC